jgi:ATP-dependent RNA helicase DeaD
MPFPTLQPQLARALAERGYEEPTPVQRAVLEADAETRDLLVSAQTGSGKTVAFGLAIGPQLLQDGARFAGRRTPLALVIAPTRELAMQVQRELEWLYAKAGLTVLACVGGTDARREARALAVGPHVVVGTPGRLCDHLERHQMDLSQLRALVLDEADEMLDMGFREELEKILKATPAERRTLMFSATLPKEILGLAKQYQRDALRIATSTENEAHGDIEYRAVIVTPHDVEHAIVNVLRWFSARGALVFCTTREAVKHLHASLSERGFSVVALSGELSQPERNRALQTLRDGRASTCVATDVAARGLDLPDLGLVIHAGFPANPQTLLHRSGRTGRAGRKGTSVVIVPHFKRSSAERLFHMARVKANCALPPGADDIRARDQERLVSDLIALSDTGGDEGIATAKLLLAERSAERLIAALVRLQRGRVPAPEELQTVPTTSGPPRARPSYGKPAYGKPAYKGKKPRK